MLALGLALALGLMPARTCTVPSYSLHGLTGAAEVVVLARVASSTIYDANGIVEVVQYLKGPPQHAKLKIYQRSILPLLGLHLAKVGTGTCLDQYAHLMPGEEALLFLQHIRGDTFTVVGNGEGYIRFQYGMLYTWGGGANAASAYTREGVIRTISRWVGRPPTRPPPRSEQRPLWPAVIGGLAVIGTAGAVAMGVSRLWSRGRGRDRRQA